MIKPERIGHVVIKVSDLARSRKFYTDVLGMEVMNDTPEAGLLFLSNHRRDHHELALIEVGPDAPKADSRALGLAHIAFRLETPEKLEAAYKELKERSVPISFTVNHGITDSVYFFDPDGHELEVYCDNPPEEFNNMPNSYLGMEKLSYAADDPGLPDVLREMGIAMQPPGG
jgi:catechol 2,3-dioxygenase